MLKLTLIGNIGRDAQLKEVNGQNLISFSVANSDNDYVSEGQKVERTTWVDCNKWQDKNQKTGVLQYLTAGSKIYVEGKMETYLYKDKMNTQRIGIRCKIERIELLGASKNTNQAVNTTVDDQAPYGMPSSLMNPENSIESNDSDAPF